MLWHRLEPAGLIHVSKPRVAHGRLAMREPKDVGRDLRCAESAARSIEIAGLKGAVVHTKAATTVGIDATLRAIA